MKKLLIIVAAFVFLSVVGAFIYFKGRAYEVVITQEQIDDVLASHFPSSKDFLIIFSITYSNPEVTLLETSDRIRIRMDAKLDIKLPGQEKNFGGHCDITTGIDYRQDQKAFYLADAEFERLELEGVPQEHLDRVTEFASKSAKHLVDQYPVYRIKGTDAKLTAAKWLLRDVQVEDERIIVTLGL